MRPVRATCFVVLSAAEQKRPANLRHRPVAPASGAELLKPPPSRPALVGNVARDQKGESRCVAFTPIIYPLIVHNSANTFFARSLRRTLLSLAPLAQLRGA